MPIQTDTMQKVFRFVARKIGVAEVPTVVAKDTDRLMGINTRTGEAFFDPNRLARILSVDPSNAYLTVVAFAGHEIGHFIRIFDPDAYATLLGWRVNVDEKAADQISGVAIKRAGGRPEHVDVYVEVLREVNKAGGEGHYGPTWMRAADVWKGYAIG